MRDTPFGPLAGKGTPGPDPDSYWVVRRRLAAGPYPYSRNVSEGMAILTSLTGIGLTAFVNLTDPATTDSHLAPYAEALRRTTPDAVMVSHPIADFHVPTVEEMKATLDSIDRLLEAEYGVYVHCWGGIGRTGTTVGCWLIRHGVATPEAALDTLGELRLGIHGYRGRPSPETGEQRRFVEAWEPAS